MVWTNLFSRFNECRQVLQDQRPVETVREVDVVKDNHSFVGPGRRRAFLGFPRCFLLQVCVLHHPLDRNHLKDMWHHTGEGRRVLLMNVQRLQRNHSVFKPNWLRISQVLTSLRREVGVWWRLGWIPNLFIIFWHFYFPQHYTKTNRTRDMNAKMSFIHFSHLNKKQRTFCQRKEYFQLPIHDLCYRSATCFIWIKLDGRQTSF